MSTLREVSKEEWLAHYRNKGDRPEDYIHVEADGTERPWTEEEWEDMILEHRRHPDLDGKDQVKVKNDETYNCPYGP